MFCRGSSPTWIEISSTATAGSSGSLSPVTLKPTNTPPRCSLFFWTLLLAPLPPSLPWQYTPCYPIYSSSTWFIRFWHEEIRFSLKSVFMVDVRFELTTNDPWSADDTICEGISPLGCWQEVNQSPTQTKPYNNNQPHHWLQQQFDFGIVIPVYWDYHTPVSRPRAYIIQYKTPNNINNNKQESCGQGCGLVILILKVGAFST